MKGKEKKVSNNNLVRRQDRRTTKLRCRDKGPMKMDPCLNHVLTWLNVWERRENWLCNLHSEFTSCWSLLGDFEGWHSTVKVSKKKQEENTSISVL